MPHSDPSSLWATYEAMLQTTSTGELTVGFHNKNTEQFSSGFRFSFSEIKVRKSDGIFTKFIDCNTPNPVEDLCNRMKAVSIEEVDKLTATIKSLKKNWIDHLNHLEEGLGLSLSV